jgi:antitoxin YefM
MQLRRIRMKYAILVQIIEQGGRMTVMSYSEVRNHLKTVLDNVVKDADYTVVTRRDAEDAVIMSLDYFEGLMETVHLLKSPANAAHLAESIAQYREGKTSEKDLIDA